MARESEILAMIRKRAGSAAGLAVGIGDDAAVIEHDGVTDLLACSDLSVEGVHFRLDYLSPRLVGRKALAVTLSDVAAMGGKNRFALVSLAVPASASGGLAEEVMQGIFEMAEAAGVAVIGGDTSSSPAGIFIDTIAIGECPRGKAVRRCGARIRDVIYVTGALGASKLGLLLLERGYRLNEAEEIFSDQDRLIQAALCKHLRPEPRLAFGQAIGERMLATAMIDISDGLSTDLSHILEESQCGAVLDAESIPIALSLQERSIAGLSLDPLNTALHSGEEYELLITAPEEKRHEVAELAEALSIKVTAIGRITEGRELLLNRNGKAAPLQLCGYEHEI